MEKILQLIESLSARIGRLVAWLVLIVVLLGAANAILRYASKGLGFHVDANALQDLQWFGFSLIFLLGAAWTLFRDEHVRVDVLYQRLSPVQQRRINLAGHTLFLLPFCVVMIWTSIPLVHDAWIIKEQSPDPGGLPRYPIKAVIPLGFVLLFLQGFATLVRTWRAHRESRV